MAPPTTPDPAPDTSCWGCDAEASIDGALGDRCRTRVAERRTDPATPRVNALIERLDSVYAHLCWHCQSALATTIGGLCPDCHLTLRG